MSASRSHSATTPGHSGLKDRWLLVRFRAVLCLTLAVIWAGLLALAVGSALNAAQRIIRERQEGLNNVLDIAVHVAQSYQVRVARRELSEQAAKNAVLAEWNLMRFNHRGYVYAFTENYVLLLNPGKPAFVGTSMQAFTDAAGHHPYLELAALAKANAERHISALEILPGTGIPIEKISTVRVVPEWGWLVAARLPVDDVKTVRNGLLSTYLLSAVGVGLVSTLLLVLVISRVQHSVGRDDLTGLLNRKGFNRRLASALSHTGCGRGGLALILVDLDGFKAVNDTHGHLYGDALLKLVAQRITSSVHSSDAVSRLGGDEFAILVSGFGESIANVEMLARRIVASVAEPYLVNDVRTTCSASAGIAAYYPGHKESHDELFQRADIALYAAKRAGKNRFAVFGASRASEHAVVIRQHLDQAMN